MSTEQIERELLKLPASERARLAERFIARSGTLEDALRDLRSRFGW